MVDPVEADLATADFATADLATADFAAIDRVTGITSGSPICSLTLQYFALDPEYIYGYLLLHTHTYIYIYIQLEKPDLFHKIRNNYSIITIIRP